MALKLGSNDITTAYFGGSAVSAMYQGTTQILGSGGGLPDIETTGLKLWADFGNTTSYPGTGTSVFDLSGNGFTGTMYGGSYTATNGGGFSMPSSADNVYFNQNVFNNSNSTSISIIGDYDKTGNYSRIFGLTRLGGTGDIEAGAFVDRVTTVGSGGSQGFRKTLPAGTWYPGELKMYTFTYQNETPYIRTFYVNDTLLYTNLETGNPARIANLGITWGAFGNGGNQLNGPTYAFTEGVIGTSYVLMAYEGKLDQAGVTKNYNAYKDKYGI